jgi:DNA-binding transcriptional LysR family regulator
MSVILNSWDHISTFLAVIRFGSLSAASRALRVAQPTIRRRIEALEQDLGVALFTRAQNGLTATPPALALLAQAEAIEAAVQSFVRSAHGDANSAHGAVRITASNVIATEILPDLLSPLLAQHSGLVVEVDASDRIEDLLQRAADVAIRLAQPVQDALLAQRVRAIEVGFFASVDYVARKGLPDDLQSLMRDHDFVGDDRSSFLENAFKANGLALPQNIRMRSDSNLVQLAAIRSGAVIGIAQTRLGQKYNLIRVLPDFTAKLDCWVVMHEDLKSVRRIRLVFDHLVDRL